MKKTQTSDAKTPDLSDHPHELGEEGNSRTRTNNREGGKGMSSSEKQTIRKGTWSIVYQNYQVICKIDKFVKRQIHFVCCDKHLVCESTTGQAAYFPCQLKCL